MRWRLHWRDPNGEGELHARRERTRLLAAFVISSSCRGDRGRRSLLWAAPSVAVVVGLFIFWPRATGAAERATERRRVRGQRRGVVRANGGGRRSGPSRSRLALDPRRSLVGARPQSRGDASRRRARRHWDHLHGEREDQRTTRVAVRDGRVVLRLRDQWAVAIGAGETWSPDLRPSASACAELCASFHPRRLQVHRSLHRAAGRADG